VDYSAGATGHRPVAAERDQGGPAPEASRFCVCNRARSAPTEAGSAPPSGSPSTPHSGWKLATTAEIGERPRSRGVMHCRWASGCRALPAANAAASAPVRPGRSSRQSRWRGSAAGIPPRRAAKHRSDSSSGSLKGDRNAPAPPRNGPGKGDRGGNVPPHGRRE